MAKKILNTGTVANDKTGDSLRDAAIKINDNFQELYYYLGNGTHLTVATVATTGSYNSLLEKPDLTQFQTKSEAFNGDYLNLSNKPDLSIYALKGYLKFQESTVPTSSHGVQGDEAGSVIFDNEYIYYCTMTYTDGVADIWKRVAWSNATW